MRTTEVHLPDENDLAGRLTDMRIWLDKHRYEPSTFTYFFLDPGMKIRVAFKLAAEATAFAQEFRGVLLDTPWASDSFRANLPPALGQQDRREGDSVRAAALQNGSTPLAAQRAERRQREIPDR